ncbi:concanavalin A-like lectin/glucanase domain-containing protein [Protomyces lactucae-debilis]|uniref:Concanavalin A-like lectin/glucanase domain-containing protein n=1 Tax=Protomyces lactucae-debilis TaxID=2754530 RepID=A0A1Y2EZB7_PROLT|nr:concanavalin A-like lectin/glucanase domain-containing protein [Protomyces lactucae-debilis]ORY76971.1 concanavalin A-like lectin/glucanase domain-containing protein [Protomyces lactucae-debilis]
MTLPSYLQGSSYAARYHAALASHDTLLEELPSQLAEGADVPTVVKVSNDKMEVRFIGPVKNSDSDAASVRANHPIPVSTGLFYFETTIVSKGREGFIGVGFCRGNVLLSRLPGWEEDSWGYHGDDGHSFCCQGTGKEYGPTFTTGDTIGCALNFSSGECFYTKNGVHLGVAFTGITTASGPLFPSIGLRTIGEHVRVNFGAQPFVFDIDHYYRLEKSRLYNEVKSAEGHVSRSVQHLVMSYLSHNGYVESARAMADDVAAQTNTPAQYPKEDTDALYRQRIRNHLVAGRVDEALALTNSLQANLLSANSALAFKLKCHKFVEMLRRVSTDKSAEDLSGSGLLSEKHANGTKEKKDVDMAEVGDMDGQGSTALEEVLAYGQQLDAEYTESNSLTTEQRQHLSDVYSLLAYADPQSSPNAHLFNLNLRVELAEEINSAILLASGQSARSELEEIVAGLTRKVQAIPGGHGAFVNVKKDFFSTGD